ncbi:GNAT family N-acetyltransferase [Paenibacillus marinisediminis]
MYVTTDKLIIRSFDFEDWTAVLEYTSKINNMKYMPDGVLNEETVKEFIRKNIGDEARNFPVILKDNGTLIGHIVFHKYFGEHTYEIGWVFNPEYHNRGYASQAALAILKYGFEEMNLHRIIATCQPENIPSYRVMEKIGMRREGYFKKCIPHENEWWDEYYYAMLREEWCQQSSTIGER